MNTLTKLSALPLELSSKVLEGYRTPGEPVVCLQIPSVGNFSPLRMRGRTNRCYRFEWDRTALCHVLRVPGSVWMMEGHALAKDVFHQVMMRPVVPVLEVQGERVPELVESEKPEVSSQRPESSDLKAVLGKQRSVARKKASAA